MKTFTIILLILTSLVFISFNKKSKYPIKYTPEVYSIGQIKSLSNSGEIKSLDSINKFIGDYEVNFWKNDRNSELFFIKEIDLTSDTTAIIAYQDTAYQYKYVHLNGSIYFQRYDTIVTRRPIQNSKEKYAPLYFKVISSDAFGQKTAFIPCVYALKKKREIHVPMVTYIAKTSSEYRSDLDKAASVNNELQESFINSILNSKFTDTIVYQQNTVIFKQKK